MGGRAGVPSFHRVRQPAINKFLEFIFVGGCNESKSLSNTVYCFYGCYWSLRKLTTPSTVA